jgi:hypothetical protein
MVEAQSTIRLEDITPSKGSLVCTFTYGTKLEDYLNSSVLYFNYDFAVEGVPKGVLSIPPLGVLAPLAWIIGAVVVAKEADNQYLSSLQKVAAVMQKMYPSVKISSAMDCTGVATPWPESDDRSCLLYSGGVDSTASLLRNLGPNLSLVSIRGTPDLRLWEEEYWNRVQQRLAPFVKGLGIERHVIETNALDVVNLNGLNKAFQSAFERGWWENLSHGLLLLSLCAPLTYQMGVRKMMIASSFSRKHSEPWGSNPAADQSICWGGLTTIHDSYDLTRLQKIREVLVPYMKEHSGAVQLRVCTGGREVRLASGSLNCGKCEKCTRTMLSLLCAGADPAECGFPTPNFVEMKAGLISGRLRTQRGYSLQTLHNEKSPPKPELTLRYPGFSEFLDWFYNWEFPLPRKRRGILRGLAPNGTRRRRVVDALFTSP